MMHQIHRAKHTDTINWVTPGFLIGLEVRCTAQNINNTKIH
jgi:hypothetical protein